MDQQEPPLSSGKDGHKSQNQLQQLLEKAGSASNSSEHHRELFHLQLVGTTHRHSLLCACGITSCGKHRSFQ